MGLLGKTRPGDALGAGQWGGRGEADVQDTAGINSTISGDPWSTYQAQKSVGGDWFPEPPDPAPGLQRIHQETEKKPDMLFQ